MKTYKTDLDLKRMLLISKAPEMLEMLEEIYRRYYDHKIEGELPITRIKQLIKQATEL